MASQVAQDFHNRAMFQNKQFVALRIQQGTKSSSPQALMSKRLDPLYYYNPLPDNSSGSKSRPFGLNKDESGRPDAMMLVAMRQAQGGSNGVIHGGVLRDYKYAQKILQQRKSDVLNIEAAAAALPPVLPNLLELSDVDQISLRLNGNLQKIIDDVEDGRVDGYTVSAVKAIPIQLIQLLPQLDINKLTEIKQVLGNIVLTIGGETVLPGKALTAIRRFINEKLLNFIDDIIDQLYKQPTIPSTQKQQFINVYNPSTGMYESRRSNEYEAESSRDMSSDNNVFRNNVIRLAKKYFGQLTILRDPEEPEVATSEESQIRLRPGEEAYSGEFAEPASTARRRPLVAPEPAPVPTSRRRPLVAPASAAPEEEESSSAAAAAEGPSAAERVQLRNQLKQYVQAAYEKESTNDLERFYNALIKTRSNKPTTANALKRSIFRKIDIMNIDGVVEILSELEEE